MAQKNPLLDLFVFFIFVHHHAFIALIFLLNLKLFRIKSIFVLLVWLYNKPSSFSFLILDLTKQLYL
jgi:hypothetical protein